MKHPGYKVAKLILMDTLVKPTPIPKPPRSALPRWKGEGVDSAPRYALPSFRGRARVGVGLIFMNVKIKLTVYQKAILTPMWAPNTSPAGAALRPNFILR